MEKRMTSKQVLIKEIWAYLEGLKAIDERAWALVEARKITTGMWMCINRHDSGYFNILHKDLCTFPMKATEQSLRITYRLLQEHYAKYIPVIEANETATYETCQRTKIQVMHGVETLEQILAWARENGYLTEDGKNGRLAHIEAVIEQTGIEVDVKVFSKIQLVGQTLGMIPVIEALRDTGYEVEESQMYRGTYFIDKAGPALKPIPAPVAATLEATHKCLTCEAVVDGSDEQALCDDCGARNGATYLLRTDDVWLGEILIEVFGPEGKLPDDGEELVHLLGIAKPELKIAPTEECWDRAVAIYEEHMNDEAREIVEGLLARDGPMGPPTNDVAEKGRYV